MNSKIKFAIIGCGSVAKKHLVSLSRIKEASLLAVCDIDESLAHKVGEEHKVPHYTDCHKMAQNEEVDVFCILTHSGDHADRVVDLIRYKKRFVIEKPMALRIEDADEMIQVCGRNGVNIYIVQQNRFNLPIRKLKEAINKGRFGKLVLGTVRLRWCRTQDYYDQRPWRGTWANDGGVLTNQASHHIDMLIWMMGGVQSVMAMTTTRLASIETEDTGVVILRFRNGALGIIEATTATRPKDLEGSISILGEKGSVEVSGFFMNGLRTWNFAEEEPEDNQILEKYGKNPDVFAWNHTEFLKDVVQSIKNNKRGLVDGLEGRKSLELISAIYESAETGKEVSLPFKRKKCKLGVKDDKNL